MKNYPVRRSVRIILLNDNDELLLVHFSKAKVGAIDEKNTNSFWTLVGGEIEQNETIQEAATRELHEETGLNKNDFILGPVVWYGKLDLMVNDKQTKIDEKFIVARTSKHSVFFKDLIGYENKTLDDLKWFSLEEIKSCKEKVYPVLLIEYLQNIIKGKYPEAPILVNFAS
jgi:8-oxo-dGTP pyrophosphatase MutT (NUDIX family)